MNYLAAPVLYIGVTHAGLCNKLGASTATSNLPATMFFAMTAMVTLIAWVSPKVVALKRNLTICYSCCAAILAALSASLAWNAPDSVKLGMVILQGAVVGAVMPATTAYLWEAIARGTDESRRGLAMGMAFGAGPFLAVVGSFCQILIIGGKFPFGPWLWEFKGIPYPWNFAVLFGAGVPMMGLAILFGQLLIIPFPEQEPQRAPLRTVIGAMIGVPTMALFFFWMYLAGLGKSVDLSGVLRWLGREMTDSGSPFVVHLPDALYLRWFGFASLLISTVALSYHFREILKQRTLLLATLVTLLVYCGNMIPPNMNLYSAEVLKKTAQPTSDETGSPREISAAETEAAQAAAAKEEKGLPADYAGTQNVYRFGFKMLAGIFYGWLLAKTNPRMGILVTSFVFLSSQFWAIFITGPAYLIAFGLYGAGELVGAYAPNYLVCASRKEDLRKTTAFMTMLMAPAAPVGYLYGSIVDMVKKNDWTAPGMNSATLGFRLSFAVCALFILSGIILALVALPKTPRVK